jgi:putative ABC transport system permease protein
MTSGGISARRALVRWARRMFCREWRQQFLVLALLTVAVAAAVASITIVHNTTPPDGADFGGANTRLQFDASNPRKLEAGLAAAKKWFGTTDVISSTYVLVPGSVERVYYRAFDPHGPYVRDTVSIRRGRYPTRPGEVAVTDGVARLMRLEVGSTLALDGRRRKVVGLVENRQRLSDEFALVTPASASPAKHVTVLVDAKRASVESFVRSQRGRLPIIGSESRPDEQRADTLAMFSVATVFLLLASLVAAAGFAVTAQRRLRQLGMLAAIGATKKHLRLVLMTHGALAGAISAVAGTTLGVALWIVVAPLVESATDHRIDRLDIPWALTALTMLLATLAATAAAWWPGRVVARLPVVLALSGRPPKPRPARHAAAAGAALIAVGVALLAVSGRDRALFIVGGLVATILGTLLLGPLAIRLFSGLAGRLSIAPRLALRDLVRYQARSGAALAAVTLALGIAATAVVVASAEASKRNAEPANLSNRQIRVHLGPNEDREGTPVDALERIDTLNAGVKRLAAELGGATVVPLGKALEADEPKFFDPYAETQVFVPLDLVRKRGPESYRLSGWLFVATPVVLRYMGIDPATIDSDTDFLVDPSVDTRGLLLLTKLRGRPQRLALTHVQRVKTRGRLFGSFDFGFNEVQTYVPPSFITLNALRRHHWRQIPSTWLIESSRPLTGEQTAAAREIAADAGFTIELRRGKTTFAKTIAIAMSAGALLALAVLAMTVGLIRSESAGDLRTLTATGATAAVRRTLTATTAGALALLGAVLGVAGSYALLAAMYHDDLAYLGDVPVLYLAVAVVGVPLAAAATGWLCAGREPPAIARTVIQ